ncbi:MAG: hypothetical protein KGL78_16410 [Burkholderiales bacterium]|nr:hypothetical protein [Burkholderiales bacterium]
MTRHPIAVPAFAAVAWTAASLLAPPAQAEAFGRLFHTPAQRATLERELPAEPRAAAAPPPAAPPAPSAPLRIDGILRPGAGRDTVWINGEMMALPPGLHLPRGDQRALIPEADPRQRLRVGDTWPSGAPGIPAAASRPQPPAVGAAR